MRYPEVINQQAARLVAFFTFTLALLTVVFPPDQYPLSLVLLSYLTLGFFLRTFVGPAYEPTAILAQRIWVNLFHLEEVPTNAMPKRFAQFIGCLFCLAGWIFVLTSQVEAYQIFFSILATFAFLEAVFNFCAGCFVFNQLIRFRLLPERICRECQNITDRLKEKAQKKI
ncbi:MAG: DUF4395 domain-containing protein [Leptospiraceae bacterium]|nr:DUF4395 domain-containing protein [Leptospiraceae bacterium]MDW8305611.1 DUF4395 domain-containing protein [Leptospiraceae bacterium]